MRDKTPHVTEIVNLPYGVAFRSTQKLEEYLILPSPPDTHDEHFYLTHHKSQALRHFSIHNTCISSLLQHNRVMINKLCQFQLRPNHLTPSITYLTQSTVLITNISSLTYICPSQNRTKVPGCLQCQITIPCRCSIDTQHGIIPPRFTRCVNDQNPNTTYHTVNLAILQSFFTEQDLGALFGDTQLNQPLHVELPEFRTLHTEDTSRLAKDLSFSYDLAKAVNVTKNQGKLFHSLADSLWHESINLNTKGSLHTSFIPWNNWTSPLYVINLILTILACIGVMFLFHRVKLLAVTVATMHVTVHKVATVRPTIPTFISYFTHSIATNTSTPNFSTNSPQNSISSSFLFILCIILVFILLFKKFQRCKINPNSHMLVLEFGNRSNTILVNYQKLPGSPNQCMFSATTFIDSIQITGRFKPQLNVEWSTLQIYNTNLNMPFTLNDKIPICHLQAYRLRQLIRGKYWCILTARYQHCLYKIDFVPPEGDTQTSSSTTVMNETVESVLISDSKQSIKAIRKSDTSEPSTMYAV